MKTTFFLLLFAVMTSSTFAAENIKTICTYDAQQRTIEVIYASDDIVPCAVQYTKSTSTETLWRAQAEEGYCEEKAQELVNKHIGWGWSCATVSNQ